MSKSKALFKFEKRDCEGIFSTAKSFHSIGREIVFRWKDADQAGRLSEFDKNDLTVAAVNLHFSLELYLKGLGLQSTGEFFSGHKLKELFEKLPLYLRKIIDDSFVEKCKNLDSALPIIKTNSPFKSIKSEYNPFKLNITLNEFLKEHSLGFVNWRYHFEIDPNGAYFADFTLMLIVVDCLIENIKKEEKVFKSV